MDSKTFLHTILAVSVLSMAAVLLFRLPAFTDLFDLSGSATANIATALAGLTGPVLSTVTIYFVWITFNAQQKTNAEQRGRNEQDLVLGMMEHLMNDYESFSITSTTRKGSEPPIILDKKGSSGMISFVKAFSDGNGEYAWRKFDETMSGDHIRFLLASFELIMERIRRSEIDSQSRLLLEKKMKMFFRLKLAGPVGILAKAFEGVQAEGALEICRLYEHYSAESLL